MHLIRITAMHKDKPQGSYIETPGEFDIKSLLEGLEPGEDSYKLEIVEMTLDEYNKLPEFTGF